MVVGQVGEDGPAASPTGRGAGRLADQAPVIEILFGAGT
jgi:hypothetical protein